MLRYTERYKANKATGLWKPYHRNSNRSIEMTAQGAVAPESSTWRFHSNLPRYFSSAGSISLLPYERIIVSIDNPNPSTSSDYHLTANVRKVRVSGPADIHQFILGDSNNYGYVTRNIYGNGMVFSQDISTGVMTLHKFSYDGSSASHDQVTLDTPFWSNGYVCDFGVSDDGSRIAFFVINKWTGTEYVPYRGGVWCFDTSDGSLIWSFERPPGDTNFVYGFNLTSDGERALISTEDSTSPKVTLYSNSGSILDNHTFNYTDLNYPVGFQNNICMIENDKIVVAWTKSTISGSARKVDVYYKTIDFSSNTFNASSTKTIVTNWKKQYPGGGFGVGTGNVYGSRIQIRTANAYTALNDCDPILVDFSVDPLKPLYIYGRQFDDTVSGNSMVASEHYVHSSAQGFVSSTNDYVYSNSQKVISSTAKIDLRGNDTDSYPGSGSNWYDLTDNSNDSTLTGTYSFTSDNGGAIDFNGGYAQLPANFLDPYGEFTIEAWVRREAGYISGNASIIFISQSSNSAGSFALVHNFYNSPPIFIPNKFAITTFEGPSEVILPTTRPSKLHQRTVKINTWYHIVGKKNSAGELEIYVNGVKSNMPDDYAVTDIALTSDDPRIAINPAAGTEFWPGSIAELRVYDYAMSEKDIQYMFNSKKVQFGY